MRHMTGNGYDRVISESQVNTNSPVGEMKTPGVNSNEVGRTIPSSRVGSMTTVSPFGRMNAPRIESPRQVTSPATEVGSLIEFVGSAPPSTSQISAIPLRVER